MDREFNEFLWIRYGCIIMMYNIMTYYREIFDG